MPLAEIVRRCAGRQTTSVSMLGEREMMSAQADADAAGPADAEMLYKLAAQLRSLAVMEFYGGDSRHELLVAANRLGARAAVIDQSQAQAAGASRTLPADALRATLAETRPAVDTAREAAEELDFLEAFLEHGLATTPSMLDATAALDEDETPVRVTFVYVLDGALPAGEAGAVGAELGHEILTRLMERTSIPVEVLR